MSDRQLPVRPNLDQLKHQAKELLGAIRAGDPAAIAELRAHHPDGVDTGSATLAGAQAALARAYGVSSWPRLVQACELIDAICRDDADAVRDLVTRNPRLLHEHANGTASSNWGPPMSYAANLGRDAIIRMLDSMGARDHDQALDRAALQSQIETARLLHELRRERHGTTQVSGDALDGPAYTLSPSGTTFMLELGARVVDDDDRRLAPVEVVLETDGRNPAAKHAILEAYVEYGLELPDTPPMAIHRGRIDLLGAHLRRDPGLLRRTFTHEEIYPPELGCHDEVLATHGTPLKGTTLLHMCVDYDELEIARWLLAQGADPNTPAAVDGDGFGGHTALFATVVSQPNFWMNLRDGPVVAPFAELLLDHGADPNVRASLRKQLHPGYDEHEPHVYEDVTPLSWGARFHRQDFVSQPAMALIRARGGRP